MARRKKPLTEEELASRVWCRVCGKEVREYDDTGKRQFNRLRGECYRHWKQVTARPKPVVPGLSMDIQLRFDPDELPCAASERCDFARLLVSQAVDRVYGMLDRVLRAEDNGEDVYVTAEILVHAPVSVTDLKLQARMILELEQKRRRFRRRAA